MYDVFKKQRHTPEILIRIWRTTTRKIGKCSYFKHNKSHGDFWKEKHTEQHSHDSGLHPDRLASRTNAMPWEDKRAAPRQRWASLNS